MFINRPNSYYEAIQKEQKKSLKYRKQASAGNLCFHFVTVMESILGMEEILSLRVPYAWICLNPMQNI